MLALFLTLTVALMLLFWAEVRPVFIERAAQKARLAAATPAVDPVAPMPAGKRRKAATERPAAPSPAPQMAGNDDDVMDRVAALMAEPEAAAPTPAARPAAKTARATSRPVSARRPVVAKINPDLPRIDGYSAGDVIELEVEGPAPKDTDIRFTQFGDDTQVSIEGAPALVLVDTQADSLTAAIFRFRSAKA